MPDTLSVQVSVLKVEMGEATHTQQRLMRRRKNLTETLEQLKARAFLNTIAVCVQGVVYNWSSCASVYRGCCAKVASICSGLPLNLVDSTSSGPHQPIPSTGQAGYP